MNQHAPDARAAASYLDSAAKLTTHAVHRLIEAAPSKWAAGRATSPK